MKAVAKSLIGILVLLIMNGQVAGAETRLLEPEEFDEGKLKRYPYFKEDAPGWYAREASCRAYGAPGKGYCAVIHEGATNRSIRHRLDSPLPAGQYKVFASSLGLYFSDKPNILKLRIGGGECNIEWSGPSSKFKWVEGGILTLTEPADDVTLDVVQFGGKGFGHLLEINSRCIPVDQIYITSDLSEETGPVAAGQHVVHGNRAAPADMVSSSKASYRTVDNYATPATLSEPVAHKILLEAYDGRKNLIPNSSFELGGGDGWSNANFSRRRLVHIFSEADHVKTKVFHGEYALRLPGKGVSDGLQFSRVFHLPQDGTYTLSGYMLATEGAGQASIGIVPIGKKNKMQEASLKAGGELTGEYVRFTATGELEAGPVVLAVWGGCLLDAVQLEQGTEASPYAPRADVEASVTTDQLAHIMYSDKPVKLVAWAHNATETDTKAKLKYRILDLREGLVAEKTVIIPVAAGKTVSQRLDAPSLRGLFNVVYASQDRPYAEGELIYTVLPPVPEDMPRHALAANMDNDPVSFDLMKRMGHKWQLYCKIYNDQPPNSNPEPGVYRWDALRQVLTMANDSGMKTMPCLWPSRVSPHLQDKELSAWEAYGDDKRDVTRVIGKLSSRPEYKRTAVLMPDLAKWQDYCTKLAKNVGDIAPWWTIDDETEMYYSPREFARIVKATALGFKASGREMKVSLSCMGDYTEEMIAELGEEVPLAGFGSSSYNYEYWEARKVAYLQRRYDVPWFCIGVGVGKSPQFRRTGPFGKGVYGRAVKSAQEMVLLTLVQDAKVIGHYTGRIWFSGGLENKDFPLMDYDCTPLPSGYVYSAIPLMLHDAVPVEDIRLPDLRTMVYVFRQGGKLHAVTWSNNVPGIDIHWESSPRVWHGLTLPAASGRVTVSDMFGNARGDVKTADSNLVLDLNEEPVFFFNKDMSDEEFLAMIKSITAKPRPISMRMALLPNGRGGVDLGVLAKNNTSETLKSLKLDANFPVNRMLTKTAWTLTSRKGLVDDIAPGEEVWGRIPTRIGLDFPVENATYTTWITDADGREHRMYDTCWLTVAPKMAAKVDGHLDEWDKVHPAWMYYTYAWSRFGRHFPQFERGGEHFKYVHRIDARAAIYAGHDEKTLYLAVQCQDDDLVRKDGGDTIEIKLNPAIGVLDGTQTILLTVNAEGVEVTGDVSGAVKADMTVRDERDAYAPYKVWTVEVAIPLDAIQATGKPGRGIGFDVVWNDADHDGQDVVTGTWRWAGRSTSLGTLMFGD